MLRSRFVFGSDSPVSAYGVKVTVRKIIKFVYTWKQALSIDNLIFYFDCVKKSLISSITYFVLVRCMPPRHLTYYFFFLLSTITLSYSMPLRHSLFHLSYYYFKLHHYSGSSFTIGIACFLVVHLVCNKNTYYHKTLITNNKN